MVLSHIETQARERASVAHDQLRITRDAPTHYHVAINGGSWRLCPRLVLELLADRLYHPILGAIEGLPSWIDTFCYEGITYKVTRNRSYGEWRFWYLAAVAPDGRDTWLDVPEGGWERLVQTLCFEIDMRRTGDGS